MLSYRESRTEKKLNACVELNFWSSDFAANCNLRNETKRNEIKICNLRNGSMLMIRKVEISIVQIISIILFRKLRISVLQIISIFSFSKIWNFIPRLKKIKELESVTFSQQTWYFIQKHAATLSMCIYG